MNPDDPRLRQLVERVDIFRGLTPDDVFKIYTKGATMQVQKGDTIFHQGTTGQKMFVVFGGKVGVFDGQKLLSELNVGDTFGEISLLTDEPRSATVVALEMSRLFVLDEDVFQKLLTKRVAVQMLLNLGRMLGKRLVAANKKLRDYEGR